MSRNYLMIGVLLLIGCTSGYAQTIAQPAEARDAETLFFPEYGNQFSAEQLNAFSQRGRQRLNDWVDYHQLLGDPEVDTEMRAVIYQELKAIFTEGVLPDFSQNASPDRAVDWPSLEILSVSPPVRRGERPVLQWTYDLQYKLANQTLQHTLVAELVIIQRQFGTVERPVQVVQLRW